MDLTGATALVTGANRGIGRAIAAELAKRPLRTVLAGVRDPSAFEPIAGRAEVRPVRLDLSSRASIDAGARDLPPVDVLVNNAGRMTGGLLEDQDTEEIYAMLQVNLAAVVHLTQRVLPGMVRRGRGLIVDNASISGYAHFPAATTYAASKAGVVAFSEALRRELQGTGVEVLHLVTPGVATDMLADTEAVYGRHLDTSRWDRVAPEDWAARAVAAMESGARVVRPGGRSELALLAARGPARLLDAVVRRSFSRRPRR